MAQSMTLAQKICNLMECNRGSMYKSVKQSHLTFDKDSKENCIHMQKKISITHCKKVNSKWTKDLNERPKAMKLLEEKYYRR